jgi:hypothetical protein
MGEKYAMNKLLLILMLVVSTSAMAEWVAIGETEEKDLTVYADPTTIRKTGNTVKMWSLDDHKMVQNPDVISSRGLDEYDCEKKQRRPLFLAAYSGHMGKGETVLIHNERGDWNPTSPGSVGESVLEFACGGFYPKLPRTFPSVSSNAAAKWVEVMSSPEKGVALYADPATIRKSGNMATMWELMDSKTAGEGPGPGNKFIHSLVSQAEYDCKDERIRFLDFIGFSENMGKGELIESEIKPISNWMLILPEDITYKKMWKLACGK